MALPFHNGTLQQAGFPLLVRRAGGYGDRVRIDGLRLLGIPPDWRDLRAPVLAAVPYAPILHPERNRRPGVPDIFGGGAVFRVRGPA